MRLARIMLNGQERVAVVREEDLIVVAQRELTVGHLLEMSPRDRDAATVAGEVHALDAIAWLTPVAPALIVGIGLNTRSHFEETAVLMNRVPGEYPPYPRLFTRSSDSLVGHGQPVLVPNASDQLDYEGEIALVIGTGGRAIAADQALRHIGGYTCCNDGSVRDYQMHSTQVTAGKNFVASGALGPWIVTSDEIGAPEELTLETHVNGELRQQLLMDDLIFSFADLIAYVSTIFTLRPGDVILTGSPAGIGGVTGAWLTPGDLVEISVPSIGTLGVPVRAERS